MGAQNPVMAADQVRYSPSWSPVFRILYRFLSALARLAARSGRSKDLEIVVLRHQLTVLHDRSTDRLSTTTIERCLERSPLPSPGGSAKAG